MDLKNKAKEMFLSGTSLVDISKKLNKPAGTIRRWKSEGRWDGGSERSLNARKKKERSIEIEKIIEATEDLNEQQSAFVRYYLQNGGNIYRAMIKAGYSESYSRTRGFSMLEKVAIKQAIQQHRAMNLKSDAELRERIKERLEKIVFSDTTDFYDEDGNIKKMHEIDGTLIKKLKKKKTGDNEEVELEIESRDKALDMLCKIVGLDKKDIDSEDDDKSLQIEVSYV